MLEGGDLRDSVEKYVAGANTNAKWMRIATIVIAGATAAYVAVAFVHEIRSPISPATPIVNVAPGAVNVAPVINLPEPSGQERKP